MNSVDRDALPNRRIGRYREPGLARIIAVMQRWPAWHQAGRHTNDDIDSADTTPVFWSVDGAYPFQTRQMQPRHGFSAGMGMRPRRK